VDQPLEFNNGHEYTKDHHENESNQNYRNEISDSEFNYLMIQLGINAFIFCVHYLCLIGQVYVIYVGHVDKSSLYETLFHHNILSKHHHYHN
jgi:hypothetical protein